MYQVTPDLLNRVIWLADIKFLESLKILTGMHLFCLMYQRIVHHTSACDSFCVPSLILFLFACILKDLQPLNKLLMRVTEYVTQSVQEYFSTGNKKTLQN